MAPRNATNAHIANLFLLAEDAEDPENIPLAVPREDVRALLDALSRNPLVSLKVNFRPPSLPLCMTPEEVSRALGIGTVRDPLTHDPVPVDRASWAADMSVAVFYGHTGDNSVAVASDMQRVAPFTAWRLRAPGEDAVITVSRIVDDGGDSTVEYVRHRDGARRVIDLAAEDVRIEATTETPLRKDEMISDIAERSL